MNKINKLRQEIEEAKKEVDITDLDSGVHKGHWTYDDILLERVKTAEAKLQGYQLAVEDFEKMIDELIEHNEGDVITDKDGGDVCELSGFLEELKSKLKGDENGK